MQFLMMWHPEANAASAGPPPAGLMTAMDELMTDMSQTNALVMTGGMFPPAPGSRLRLAEGKVSTIDGPFTEAKELIGGYCIVQADSEEAAMQMARRFVEIHAPYGYEGTADIRRLMGPEDFVFTPNS
jgi:hypothetical protein